MSLRSNLSTNPKGLNVFLGYLSLGILMDVVIKAKKGFGWGDLGSLAVGVFIVWGMVARVNGARIFVRVITTLTLIILPVGLFFLYRMGPNEPTPIKKLFPIIFTAVNSAISLWGVIYLGKSEIVSLFKDDEYTGAGNANA